MAKNSFFSGGKLQRTSLEISTHIQENSRLFTYSSPPLPSPPETLAWKFRKNNQRLTIHHS